MKTPSNGKTHYAKSGDYNIAYRVLGDGPIDLVFVPGFVSNVELALEIPGMREFYERLASFSRLIMFDKRGTGMSDRVPPNQMPTLEERMDDVRAVMDAVGIEKASLFGLSEGGPMSILFAATYPARATSLVLCGSFARLEWGAGMLTNLNMKYRDFIQRVETDWANGFPPLSLWAPSLARFGAAHEMFARYMRQAASPGAATVLLNTLRDIDVRGVLSSLHVPTLVLHSKGDLVIDVTAARYLAEHIPNAKYVELPGGDHFPWGEDMDQILGETEEFLTGTRREVEPDRVLATVLFTDIVASTEQAAALGDRNWRHLLDSHHEIVRRELDRNRGREVDTAGDGFFATFDGPARAIRCATGIRDALKGAGIRIRAGLHTGECELHGEKVSGLAVHIGARVLSLAQPEEVLVSGTTKDLVVGSGLTFADKGSHQLKGVPGEWRLYAVA